MTCEACGKPHGGVNERIHCLSTHLRGERAQNERQRETIAKLVDCVRSIIFLTDQVRPETR